MSESCSVLKPWKWRGLMVPLVIMVLGLAMVPLGPWVYHWVHHVLRKLPLSSVFATVVQASSLTVVIGLGCVVYSLDRKNARYLIYLLVALGLAGGVNSVVKQLAGRSRPEWSVDISKDKAAELREFQRDNPDVLISLGGVDSWLGVRGGRPWFKDRYDSFPSGHSCGVFVIAAFLCVLYPAGRWIWLLVAAGCALARVYGARHYVEDVMVGGALGWGVALWVFSWRWPLRLILWVKWRLKRFYARQRFD